MSNLYESYQSLTEDRINQLIEEKLSKKTKSTVWHNPVSDTYWQANNPSSYEPSYDQYVCDGKVVGRGLDTLKGASNNNLTGTEIDNARFSGISDEFLDQANRMWSDIDKARKLSMQGQPLGAGVITTTDYAAIANVIVDSTTFELVTRDFALQDAVTPKTSQNLTYSFDDTTPYLNEADVGENDVIDPRQISYTRGSVTLKKAQGHVKASRWAELAARDHNVTQDNFSIVAADFPRIFNTDIATTMAGFTDNAAAGAYDVIAAANFHSTTNPMTEFTVDSAAIRTAGGMANTMAMNSLSYYTLAQNTYMRTGGFFGTLQPFQNAGARSGITHPMFPGFTIYIDELMSKGDIHVYDKRAIEFITGPSRTATVNNDEQYFVSQIHDRWYTSHLRVATWGSEQTGTVT
jgi:hypothetical protein